MQVCDLFNNMTKKQVQKILSDMFVPRSNGLDGKCFRIEYMDKENEAYPIQQAISEAQRESGLSFDFSYVIAKKACDILAELEDWKDEDAITEAVDAIVSVYTHDLMQIYASDSWAVDEAVEDMGSGGDSITNAQYAWYRQIESMARDITQRLDDVIGDDEEEDEGK